MLLHLASVHHNRQWTMAALCRCWAGRAAAPARAQQAGFKLSLLQMAAWPWPEPHACPMQMLGEQIDVLRKTAGGRAQLLHAVSAKMSTFEAAEVERLQHAFVRLGGGDARKARVTEDRLT